MKKTQQYEGRNLNIVAKTMALLLFLLPFSALAQEHFSGINTSQRTGIINVGINPAELTNFSTTYDVNVFSGSVKGSNSNRNFSDLLDISNFMDVLFQGQSRVSLRLNGEIYGPSFAYKMNNWAFAFSTKAHAKLDLVDVDTNFGDALTGSAVSAFLTGSSSINSTANQRAIGASWGEIGFSAAHNFYEDSNHKFNAGATLKILFPGSYMNLGIDQFRGTITNTAGDLELTDAQAGLHIAYSGNLGESFTEANDYFKSFFGKPNGFAADLGVNYQLKEDSDDNYKLNVGLALRNLGSMTFDSSNNSKTSYVLSIQGSESLDLNQFQNVKSMKEIENILLTTDYFDKTQNSNQVFKIKLPVLFSAYADVKILPSFYVTAYTQLKVKHDDENDQITEQNIVTVTPRYTVKNYEVYVPFSQSEFSGFAAGIGFRAYGFFLGSGSAITTLLNKSKQTDVHLGYSFKLDEIGQSRHNRCQCDFRKR